MQFPSLQQLPAPPPGRVGWPWTEASPQLPDMMPDGAPWPRVSIVTPSYNQGQFIEETIRSVLLQGYPDLEYIIMDGGSTDGSVEVIKRYAPWLTLWASKPDKGQSDALYEGFNVSIGSVLGWLNSDDVFAPNALFHLCRGWAAYHPAILSGAVAHFTTDVHDSTSPHIPQHLTFADLLRPWREVAVWQQPGMLFSGSVYREAGGIDRDMHMAMDYDLFLRILSCDDRALVTDYTVAFFREHPGSKTAGVERCPPKSLAEEIAATSRFVDRYTLLENIRWRLHYAMSSWRRASSALARRNWPYVLGNLREGSKLGLIPLFAAFGILCVAKMQSLLMGDRHA